MISMVLLSCLSCSGKSPVLDTNEDGLRVLFIGNSLTYSNDLPVMLHRMLQNAEIPIAKIESVAFANFGLQDHWVSGEARTEIATGGWDIVVLQQGPSATEGRPSLLEYSERFAEEIAAAGAQTALYMVWPSASRFLILTVFPTRTKPQLRASMDCCFLAEKPGGLPGARNRTLHFMGRTIFTPVVWEVISWRLSCLNN